MFWAFLGVLVVAEAAKLNNAYLPPSGAKESGGSDGALQVPLEPPYVDQYSPNSVDQQLWRPGTRAIERPVLPKDDSYLENEDEITVPALEKGRFISGSYSYTGPDNVLVTVTYKANDKKARKENTEEENEEQSAEGNEDEEEDETSRDLEGSLEDAEDEDTVVPTPPTLPSELARAFDFHKKKHLQPQENDLPKGKTNRRKKPLRKNHGHGHVSGGEHQHGGRAPLPVAGAAAPAAAPAGSAPGYHYTPASQGLYSTPTIHQGYSYPKQS